MNPDAIVFWEKDGDNSEVVDLISKLDASPAMYDDFSHQPRLKAGAEDYVLGRFHELERRIKDLL